MQKGFVIILILAVIIAIFAISNSAVVPINFIFTEVVLSQAIVIFVCVLLGAIVASIFGGIKQMSLKKEINGLEAENKELEKQINKANRKLNDSDNQMKITNLEDLENNEWENEKPIDDF